ncbi:MAG: NUDIX hydrolase [Candidatus Liptonbacteria bacterium]|nr:NUDIX hydrolase [Candidatus Liptonbacteria bacterium]
MRSGVDYIAVGIAFACHDGKGNYLWTKRSNKCRDEHGTWCFPGGGVEFGESLEETVRRETKEEYGAEALQIEFMGVREVRREHEGKPTHWMMFDYKVLVSPAEVKNLEPDMADELAWFKLTESPAPLHSQVPVFLGKYLKILET